MYQRSKWLFNTAKEKLYLLPMTLPVVLTNKAYAAGGDNPFPSITPTNSGDVVQTAGTTMESAMKYLTIGLGGLLILICLGVIIHRMREDNRDKDHGNLIMTYVLCALGMTLGFVLIGIGWKAFGTQVQ